MVIDDGERMPSPAVRQRHVTLEVHLPKQIGRGLLEAMLRHRATRWRIDPAVPAQDLVHGRMRRTGCLLTLETMGDLASAPGRVSVEQRQNARFRRCCGSRGARMRPPRAIGKLVLAHSSTQPLVTSVRINPEPSAQLAPVRSFLHCQPDKLTPLVHYRHLAPRHGWPP